MYAPTCVQANTQPRNTQFSKTSPHTLKNKKFQSPLLLVGKIPNPPQKMWTHRVISSLLSWLTLTLKLLNGHWRWLFLCYLGLNCNKFNEISLCSALRPPSLPTTARKEEQKRREPGSLTGLNSVIGWRLTLVTGPERDPGGPTLFQSRLRFSSLWFLMEI